MVTLLLLLLNGPALAQEGSPAEVAWSQVSQERLPQLEARRTTAQRRLAAIEALAAGETSLAVAMPHLQGLRLDDMAVLGGLRVALDQRARRRADESSEALPELGSPERRATLAKALQGAQQAEAAADAAEREVLVALEAWLGRNPRLAGPNLKVRLDRLTALADEARALAPSDPGAQEALARAARADTERAAWGALQAELQLATLQDREPAPPEAELETLAAGTDDEWSAEAAARLGAAGKAWSGEVQARVDGALTTWLQEVRLPAARAALTQEGRAALEVEGLDLAATQARLAQVSARLAAPPPEEDAGGDALLATQRELQLLQREALESEEAALQIHIEELGRQAAEASAKARRSQEAAVATRQQADEAKASAKGESERRAAEVLDLLATASERSALAWNSTHQMEEDLQTADDARSALLSTSRTAVVRLETESPVTPDLPDPDKTFRDLRSLVDTLRRDAAKANKAGRTANNTFQTATERLDQELQRLAAERQGIASMEPLSLREEHEQHLQAWGEAIEDERAALLARTKAWEEGAQTILRELREAQQLRQRLRPKVTGAARSQDRAYLVKDIGQELLLLPARLELRVSDRLEQLWDVPARLANWNLIKAFLWGSSGVVLVMVGWWAARRRTMGWTDTVLARIAAGRRDLRAEDLDGARQPTHRAFETLLDLIIGWLLINLVQDGIPEVALALFIYLHLAAYRFGMALWELAFAKTPAVRPSLRTLAPQTWTSLRRTVRLALLWWVSRNLVLTLLPDLLGLYSLAEVVDALFTLALVVFALRELWRWEPTLRGIIARRHQDSPVVRWLSVEPKPAVLAPIQGAAGMLFVGATVAAGLISNLSREGSSLARVFTQVGRLRLGKSDEPPTQHEAAPPELVEAIIEAPLPPEAAADRGALVARAFAQWEDWNGSPRRGLVMIVGDRGEGKGTVADAVVAAIGEHTGVITRATITRRLASSLEATTWLGKLLEVDPAHMETPESLSEALRDQPPRVIVLDDLHRAFVRAVDGFAGLQAILYVMNSTGDRHFWLTTSHRPAWHFLSQLGGLVNTGLYRETIELPALSEGEMQKLCLAKTRSAGFEADFSGLVRPNLLGDDPAVELDRATRLFFRLLREDTGGNPAVTLHHWAQCLRRGESPEAPLRVWTAPVLRGEAADGLSTTDLFILGALRTQDHLEEQELADVTDLPLSAVRTTVRDLMGRGFVVPVGNGFEVDRSNQPAVTRALRRRNFIQWGV